MLLNSLWLRFLTNSIWKNKRYPGRQTSYFQLIFQKFAAAADRRIQAFDLSENSKQGNHSSVAGRNTYSGYDSSLLSQFCASKRFQTSIQWLVNSRPPSGTNARHFRSLSHQPMAVMKLTNGFICEVQCHP